MGDRADKIHGLIPIISHNIGVLILLSSDILGLVLFKPFVFDLVEIGQGNNMVEEKSVEEIMEGFE